MIPGVEWWLPSFLLVDSGRFLEPVTIRQQFDVAFHIVPVWNIPIIVITPYSLYPSHHMYLLVLDRHSIRRSTHRKRRSYCR